MKIAVIGLGRAGIVASVGLAGAGHEVLGVDLDAERLQRWRPAQRPSTSRAWTSSLRR